MSNDNGVLRIGSAEIPYRIRRSARAKRKSITVEPGGVEVVVPEEQDTAEAHRFVQSKRRWIFEQSQKLSGLTQRERSYATGSKLRFRGRWLTLEVRAGRRTTGSVECRSRLQVTLPRGVAKEERPAVTRVVLAEWFEQQLLADGQRFARRYAAQLGTDMAGVAVVPMTRMWASCGKDRIVRLNPDLIELPKSVLEYVLAHEVCHLVHRNHSEAFWQAVASVIPDWQDRQASLGEYELNWAL